VTPDQEVGLGVIVPPGGGSAESVAKPGPSVPVPGLGVIRATVGSVEDPAAAALSDVLAPQPARRIVEAEVNSRAAVRRTRGDRFTTLSYPAGAGGSKPEEPFNRCLAECADGGRMTVAICLPGAENVLLFMRVSVHSQTRLRY